MANNNVLVNNLCAWPLGFKRLAGQGSVILPANAKAYPLLSFEEVVAQIQNGNVMFIGTDGMGSHARIEIVDPEMRKKVFGVDETMSLEPVLLNEESVKELLKITSKAKFKSRLEEMVQTDAEKKMLVDIAYKCGAEDAVSWKVDAIRELSSSSAVGVIL